MTRSTRPCIERLEGRTLFSAAPIGDPGLIVQIGPLEPPVGAPAAPPSSPPANFPQYPLGSPAAVPGLSYLSPDEQQELLHIIDKISRFSERISGLASTESGLDAAISSRQQAVAALQAQLSADRQISPPTKAVLADESRIEQQIGSDRREDNEQAATVSRDSAKQTADRSAYTKLYDKGALFETVEYFA